MLQLTFDAANEARLITLSDYWSCGTELDIDTAHAKTVAFAVDVLAYLTSCCAAGESCSVYQDGGGLRIVRSANTAGTSDDADERKLD